MGRAFFIYKPSIKDAEPRDDKIIPDPVTLGPVQLYIDGNKTLITATSGQIQYVYIDPEEYPSDEQSRKARRGSVRS